MSKKLEKIKFLKGKRIYLRPLERDDLPVFLRWMNDLETAQLVNHFLPVMKEGEDDFYEKTLKEKGKIIVLSVCTNKDELIGTISINNIKWKDGTATTGTLIGDKSFRGKGYGTEAKMVLLNYAFNTLNLRKISCNILSTNERSIKCQEGCGYKQEGVRKKHTFINGEYIDDLILAVFKEDWAPLWEDYKKKYL